MVYQRTGVTDPKESQRKKHLSTNNEKVTPHTVKIEKGSLLRRSGVSFRSEAVENQMVTRAAQASVQEAAQNQVRDFPKKRPHGRRSVVCYRPEWNSAKRKRPGAGTAKRERKKMRRAIDINSDKCSNDDDEKQRAGVTSVAMNEKNGE